MWPPGTAHRLSRSHVRILARRTRAPHRRENTVPVLARGFSQTAGSRSLDRVARRRNSRVATVYAAKSGRPPEPRQFYLDLVTPGTLARKTFSSAYGLQSVSGMNRPAVRAESIVSFGGIGSASALAKFYSMLANGGNLDGQTFFSEQTIEWMTTTLTDDMELVFQIPTAFSAGFMKDPAQRAAVSSPPSQKMGRIGNRPSLVTQRLFGPSSNAFGHPGAGGSHAFADPENKISFAYVMNQMEQSLLPNEKSLRLVDAIYRSI